MVAKKRTKLRDKVSRLNAKESAVEEEVPYTYVLGEDPKAFLHQSKETKKEKQSLKHSSFLDRLREKSSANDFSGISKSAARRRKRKLRDDLKPKMQDLLTSLENDVEVESESGEEEYHDTVEDNHDPEIMEDAIPQRKVTRLVSSKKLKKHEKPSGSIVIKKNAPNIRNQRGAKQLSKQESERFNKVLTNQTFQQNPFGSLRDIIKMQKY